MGLYAYLGIALSFLFLVWKIISAWNSGKVAEEKSEQAKERTERIRAREEGKTDRSKLRNERRKDWFERRRAKQNKKDKQNGKQT